MNLLVQSVRRTHLENLKTVWEEVRNRGHHLWFQIFQDNELSYDHNTLQDWWNTGWNVIEGNYQELVHQKDYSGIRDAFKESQPDLLLPLKHTTDVWKETTRAIDLSSWAGRIITFQDAFSAIRGNPKPVPPLPTPPDSTTPWFLVWGKQYKRKLLYNGYPEDRILVTGNPAWDWCVSAQLPPPRYVLFLGGAPQEWLPRIDFRHIYHDFGNEVFVFKDHPVQADKKYSFIQQLIHLRMYPNKRIKVHNHQTATELIREAKIVVTTTSSCAIESMLCGKPTIVVDIDPESKKFSGSGRLIPATYFSFNQELMLALKKKEDRSQIAGFIQDTTHQPDGKAYLRMVEVIERIGDRA